MNVQRANDILRALVQGVHPSTGEPLPHNSVLQNAEVLRALLAGIEALEGARLRAARRAQLPDNVGRPWTEAEIATLRCEFEGGRSLEEIARAHGRSTRAISLRLGVLGLVEADTRLPWMESGGAGSSKSKNSTKG